ncbi:TPR-like protein [Obba rivulosa]|uniref:TPR-like protein n=1 Tax=Obba rivulosa TaxID=1052685 RepID=A0A8E2DTX9_9APHY|nr:TPR-like protein [Obba rivulosa]
MLQEPPPALSTHLCHRFSSLIWACLDADLLRSAVFYAERYYVCDVKNHDARHLYATALLRVGRPHSALFLVSLPTEARCSGCLEIKAKCCSALGRHRQAREALEASLRDASYTPTLSMSSRTSTAFPDEAVMHCRVGNAAVRGNLADNAAASYRQALALNPMLWEAFEGICTLGKVPDINELFPPRPPPMKRASSEIPPSKSMPVATGAGFFTPEAGNDGNLFRVWKADPSQTQAFRLDVPAGPRDSIATADSSFNPDGSFTHAPIRASRSQPTTSLLAHPPAAAATSSRSLGVKAREQVAPGNATRRSTRLLSGTSGKTLVAKTGVRERRRAVTRTRTRTREQEAESDMDEEPAQSQSPPPGAQEDSGAAAAAAQEAYEMQLADHHIYELMRMFARAARAMAFYDCRACLDELENLPSAHKRSAWVMAMVGKAHYELGEYSAAERAFEAVRTLEPYRLDDMEVYSTLLWHLQRNVRLAFLAQELLATDPRAPQAWIAVGNCFSLQKERPQALTCFRRAAQLDPTCAYAYTLSGHESVDEDLEKAIHFFESALRADPRHYNAWYGLGTCYMRMNKLRLAEYHYRKAMQIHPQNAVLLGCVGMVTERYGDREKALELFDQAVRLSPENALVRYRRAKILIAQKRYTDAVADLEYLRDTSPEESNVIFQLAKVYRLMGDEVRGAQLLAVARDVSPKSVHKIRKLLETGKDAEEVMDEG